MKSVLVAAFITLSILPSKADERPSANEVMAMFQRGEVMWPAFTHGIVASGAGAGIMGVTNVPFWG